MKTPMITKSKTRKNRRSPVTKRSLNHRRMIVNRVQQQPTTTVRPLSIQEINAAIVERYGPSAWCDED